MRMVVTRDENSRSKTLAAPLSERVQIVLKGGVVLAPSDGAKAGERVRSG